MGKIKDNRNTIMSLPIWANTADVVSGAFLKKGTTPATNNGALMPCTGTGPHADVIGRLSGKLTYATEGQTLIDGTTFVVKPVELAHPFRIHRIDYSLATADLITATQAVSTTTMTLTSLEDNIDAGFVYVGAGLGIGQSNFLTASAAGAATLKAAFTTALDTTSLLVKILPRFHNLAQLSVDGSKLASAAAAGAWAVIILDTWYERNGLVTRLDPTKHSALRGLNGARSLKFSADVAVRDTIPYTID